MKNSIVGLRHQSHGFGLIELLVAMAIGLLLMGATLKLYIDLSRSNQEMAKVNQQVEAGGVAIQILRQDLLHAGFWNGYVPEFDDFTHSTAPTDYPLALPDTCEPFASWGADEKKNRLGVAVQIFPDVPTGCSTTAQLPNKLADSDVLVVRYAETCVAGTANCAGLSDDDVYFQASECEGEASYVIARQVTATNLTQRDCATPAERRKLINNIYYLANQGGTPTLMRSVFKDGVQQLAEPLVEGVEAMRFELGIDQLSDTGAPVALTSAVTWSNNEVRNSPTNRGDGAADAACKSSTCSSSNPAEYVNTVMVRTDLLVRALEATPGFTDSKVYSLLGDTYPADGIAIGDGFKRHVYSSSMRLANVSGRRETP